jgi:hypothetical protein
MLYNANVVVVNSGVVGLIPGHLDVCSLWEMAVWLLATLEALTL